MSEITLQHHRTVWHFVPGLALSAVVTGVALWGGSIPAVAGAGFSALTLAILLGMVVGNTVYPHIWKSCDGGVIFAKQHLLRLGIILYGFRLTFSQIADVGVSGIAIDVLTLSSTFLLACFIGQKIFGLDKQTSWLIGAGSSICGAAAVLATEPVVKAEASKVTVAVATVVIFGTLAIFLYPAMYPLVAHWFSPETYGIYIGSTMHEVAQVVAAGHAINPEAENAAVIAKMLRVMMLAPFLISRRGLNSLLRQAAARKAKSPFRGLRSCSSWSLSSTLSTCCQKRWWICWSRWIRSCWRWQWRRWASPRTSAR